MTIIFPHGNDQEIPLVRFVASWKFWFAHFHPECSWRTSPMPRLNSAVVLQKQLENGNRFSLDVLCRVLVARPYRNTMQATRPFMVQNNRWLSAIRANNPRSGLLVNCACLTREALGQWDELTDDQRKFHERLVQESIPTEILTQ